MEQEELCTVWQIWDHRTVFGPCSLSDLICTLSTLPHSLLLLTLALFSVPSTWQPQSCLRAFLLDVPPAWSFFRSTPLCDHISA